MKVAKHFVLVAVISVLAGCFLSWSDQVLLSLAQKQKERRGPLEIVDGSGNTVAPPGRTGKGNNVNPLPPNPPLPTPRPKPSPVSLPVIASAPKPRLVVGLIRWGGKPVFPTWIPIGEETIPPPPPPKVELFPFDTVTIDRREKVLESKKETVRGYREYVNDDVWIELVEIPNGEFMMGTPEKETNRKSETVSERSEHKVTIQKFWMGRYEITQEQWRAVVHLPKVKIDIEDQSRFKGDKNLPAENLTWNEAVEFCARLEKKTGRLYRLPTEAEWEYAARARTTTPFAFGETITMSIANYNGDAFWDVQTKVEGRRTTVSVGSLGKANAFGLFDMHGNVWEWCQDDWHDNYNGAPIDGSAWMSGKGTPVIRGGSYDDAAADCRSAKRYTYHHSQLRRRELGFRIAVSKPF